MKYQRVCLRMTFALGLPRTEHVTQGNKHLQSILKYLKRIPLLNHKCSDECQEKGKNVLRAKSAQCCNHKVSQSFLIKVVLLKEVVQMDLGFAAFVSNGCGDFLYKLTIIFILFLTVSLSSCGGSSSENNTFISQSSVTSLSSPCLYTICRCSTNICRIRFDLNVCLFV